MQAEPKVDVPASLLPALRGLQAMLAKFWPEEAAAGRLPLAFWRIDDDAVLFDALQYFPCQVATAGGASGRGLTTIEVDALPEGFRSVLALFELEDALAGEGWHGLANLGLEGLDACLAAHRRVGLVERATVLERVRAAMAADPDDAEAA